MQCRALREPEVLQFPRLSRVGVTQLLQPPPLKVLLLLRHQQQQQQQ